MSSKRSSVHLTFKTKYRVGNWRQYDPGRVSRIRDVGASIGVARKIAVLLHAVWTKDRAYEPLAQAA